MAKMDITLDTSRVDQGLRNYVPQVRRAIKEVADLFARVFESRAKAEHAWVNRTTDAETGLKGDTWEETAKHIVGIYLKHGEAVFYGWYLETKPGTRNSQNPQQWKYSIIMPVLESSYEELMRALRRIFQ